jgi:predicted MFS family arabinose efflux permease
MRSVTHAQALAGTSNVSAAHAGIGTGAIVGGMTVSNLGIGYLGYVAAAVAVLALLLALAVRNLAPER